MIAKLERAAHLFESDRAAILEASRETRECPARRDIISEGDDPEYVHLMIEGWAARYKVVHGGARQITAYLIPGDFCDLHVTLLRKMDHGIIALTPATVAFISREKISHLMQERPALTRALWWATLVDEAVLRAWIVNIGRRDAYERIGHLMCEMHIRMKNIGLVDDGLFDLPITQVEIADSVGLTPVHVNRTLKRLRDEGLIELSEKRLTILDPKALAKAAGFDSGYLHTEDLRSERAAVAYN